MKRVVYGLGATAALALGAAPITPAAGATGDVAKHVVKSTPSSPKRVSAAATTGCVGTTYRSVSDYTAGWKERLEFYWAYSSFRYAVCIGTVATSLDNFGGTSGVSAARIRIWHSGTLEDQIMIPDTTGKKVAVGIHEYFPAPTAVCAAWFAHGIVWYSPICTTVG